MSNVLTNYNNKNTHDDVIIIIIMMMTTSYVPLSLKIVLSGVTKPRD